MHGGPAMRPRHFFIRLATCGFAALAAPAGAVESGFNIYPVGSLTFGAGQTPPPGLYISPFIGYYEGSIGGNVNIGRALAVDLSAQRTTLRIMSALGGCGRRGPKEVFGF